VAMELKHNLSKQREMAPPNARLILKQSRGHLYLKTSCEI